MSETTLEFADLMQLVAQRDDQAISQLYHRYNDLLLSYLRKLLGRRPLLRTLFDAEWIANGIWADLFCAPARCRGFVAPHRFVGYLLGMARNQVAKNARDFLDTQKRDLRRRRHLSDPFVNFAAGAVADTQPTPAQHAQDTEVWKRYLRYLIGPEHQLIGCLTAAYSCPIFRLEES